MTISQAYLLSLSGATLRVIIRLIKNYKDKISIFHEATGNNAHISLALDTQGVSLLTLRVWY